MVKNEKDKKFHIVGWCGCGFRLVCCCSLVSLVVGWLWGGVIINSRVVLLLSCFIWVFSVVGVGIVGLLITCN